MSEREMTQLEADLADQVCAINAWAEDVGLPGPHHLRLARIIIDTNKRIEASAHAEGVAQRGTCSTCNAVETCSIRKHVLELPTGRPMPDRLSRVIDTNFGCSWHEVSADHEPREAE